MTSKSDMVRSICRGILVSSFFASMCWLPIAAQIGFLSIDCGGAADVIDDLGIEWVTDDGFISHGTTEHVSSSSYTYPNDPQSRSLRIFPESRSKHCYVLPTSTNTTYLIRGGFLHPNPATLSIDFQFNISIDTTIVDGFRKPAAETLYVLEYIVASGTTRDHIVFCLIPVVGVPFINTIELRRLNSESYAGGYGQSPFFFRVLQRVNCGVVVNTYNVNVRYPDDIYDRFWWPPGNSTVNNYENINATTVIDTTAINNPEKPPLTVLQTAWEAPTISVSFNFYGYTVSQPYYLAFYFAEVDLLQSFRSMDLYLDSTKLTSDFNVTTEAVELYSTISSTSFVFNTAGIANLTLVGALYPGIVQTNSILNAYEIHALLPFETLVTDAGDVQAIDDLRTSLNLLDWNGDPCLPVAFEWVTCNSLPRITQLNLTNYNLTGTIPGSIASLTDLTDLWLDDNQLHGTIPDLSALTRLQTIHLEGNLLTGPIPASLATLPVLSELFLQNNELSGPIPQALLTKISTNGLNLVTSPGNPGLCLSNATCTAASGPSSNKSNSRLVAAIGGTIGGLILIVIIILLVICLVCRRKTIPVPQQEVMNASNWAGAPLGAPTTAPSTDPRAPLGGVQQKMARAFSYEEIKTATVDFRRQIGNGGFGPVFYGRLPNGEELAVKVNAEGSGQGYREFFTEVSLLSRVHHVNLVSLVGFCEEEEQQILIYEFMPNGTLTEHLYGNAMKPSLDWRTRLEIALSAARGLEYLHNDCSPKIIHRDVKSNNILLNAKMVAKVADFGVSKLAPDEDLNGISTVVKGTLGYLDPEYFQTTKLTQKSDVYAFGVVLLEIICGRAPNNKTLDDVIQWNLVEYARTMLSAGNVEAIVDPRLGGNYNLEAMWKVAELAMFSVEPVSARRPDMRKVVRELTEAQELEFNNSAGHVSANTIFNGNPNTPNAQSSNASTQSSLVSYDNYMVYNPSAPPVRETPPTFFNRPSSDIVSGSAYYPQAR